MFGTSQFTRTKMSHWIALVPAVELEKKNETIITLLHAVAICIQELEAKSIGGFSRLIAYCGTQIWNWLRAESRVARHEAMGTMTNYKARVLRKKQRLLDEETVDDDDEIGYKTVRGPDVVEN